MSLYAPPSPMALGRGVGGEGPSAPGPNNTLHDQPLTRSHPVPPLPIACGDIFDDFRRGGGNLTVRTPLSHRA